MLVLRSGVPDPFKRGPCPKDRGNVGRENLHNIVQDEELLAAGNNFGMKVKA